MHRGIESRACPLGGLATTIAAADTAAEAFFRPAPDLAQKYDADKLFPQGRIFPVAFYGLNLGRDKPEGLTLIGPYGREQNIEAAKKSGLKCTYSISLPMEFHSNKPLELSPDEIRRRIREQVEAVAGHAEIAWWYLAPEELRYWHKNEITYLEEAADAIRQADPLEAARVDVRSRPPRRRGPGTHGQASRHLRQGNVHELLGAA